MLRYNLKISKRNKESKDVVNRENNFYSIIKLVCDTKIMARWLDVL